VRDSTNPKIIKMLFPHKVRSSVFPQFELTDENGEFILERQQDILKCVVEDIYLYFRDKSFNDVFTELDSYLKNNKSET
jgi:hypothetical protein